MAAHTVPIPFSLRKPILCLGEAMGTILDKERIPLELRKKRYRELVGEVSSGTNNEPEKTRRIKLSDEIEFVPCANAQTGHLTKVIVSAMARSPSKFNGHRQRRYAFDEPCNGGRAFAARNSHQRRHLQV
jgi:hypothetical protein